MVSMLRLLENPERALPDAALEDVNDVRFVDEFLTREIEDQDPLSVLLVCRERAALRWGPRWLERVGFEVRVATSLSKARTILGSEESSVVVIEGGIRDRSGERAYLPLLERAKTMGVPVVVIASSLRDAKHALFAGAAEVAQRPHDWRVISRRAALVAVAHRASKGLDKAREAVAAARAEIASVLHRQELGAGTDSLTELPNRKIFLTLLEQTFSSPRPLDAMSAVLYVDLDRFGSVNESLGRDKADKLLALVAERLRRTFHGPELLAARTSGLVSATLARLGGDEFGLVISNVSSAEHLNPFFELLQEELNDSFELDDKQYYLSASFGVALYPHDGADAEEMLHHAELAMTQAKDLGGGMLRFYKPSLHTQARRQVAMSRDLSAALAGDELELHYQPIVDAKSGRTVAVEALLRWYHPEQGLIMPNEFIAVAEQASLMVPIGNWVIRTACAQLRTWLDAGLSPMRMAVNIARCQLLRPNLLEDIEDALLSADLDPGLLEIELSERGVLGHRAEIRELLAKIKSLGVRVALDDFGTGDSAIVYLRRLPVDSLKIDRSYISGMHDNEDNKIIASAMVAMAHELKLDVVAEGVETPEQLQNVTDWGCDEIQGFLFARPQPAADIPDIVAALEAEGLARLASSGE